MVQQPCSSCCGNGFCAAAMFSVPRHCASCRSQSLHAVTIFFFRGVVLCAMALCYVPQHRSLCHGVILCAAAMLFVPRQACGFHGIVLCVAARNDLPQHCTAFCTIISTRRCVLRQVVPFRGIVLHAAVIFLCATARNDAPRHSTPSFFVPQQDTKRSCISWHCASCRGMLRRAVALFAVP